MSIRDIVELMVENRVAGNNRAHEEQIEQAITGTSSFDAAVAAARAVKPSRPQDDIVRSNMNEGSRVGQRRRLLGAGLRESLPATVRGKLF